MKEREFTFVKKVAVLLVALALLAGGCFVLPTEAEETSNEDAQYATDKVFVKYSKDEATSYYEEHKAPKYEGTSNTTLAEYGYLFGGWFTREDKDGKVIYTPVGKDATLDKEEYWAKFVPSYVLSVKCQNLSGWTTESDAQDNGKACYRALTGVDSLNYQSVGFNVQATLLNEDTNCFQKAGNEVGKYTSTVYHALRVNYLKADGTSAHERLLPSDMLGTAANYLVSYQVQNIPVSYYGTPVWVRPYWITLDGTTVYGLSKYTHVEDGYYHTDEATNEEYRYVNIPINLRSAEAESVAGILTLSYSSKENEEIANLEFAEVEGGRFFEEMDWTSKADSQLVRVVGNRKDITTNHQDDEVFANIRFKVARSEADKNLTGFHFDINSVEFGDSSETKLPDYKVWDIKF